MASVLDSAELPPAPYPGLRPFQASEWRIFFGREAMAREVTDLVYKHRFVMVHGVSGSGKSSLIKAGVLPGIELEERLAGHRWACDTLKPSEGPLIRLERILETHFPAAECLPKGGTSARWMDEIHKGPGLLAAIERAIATKGGGRFCLLIDQFEELFRLSGWSGPAEARLFVEILNRAADPDNGAPGLSVILTMRSDYLGHCARYDGFAETVNRCQYLLPKMDNLGLLMAIHKPAEMYGGTVAEAAADALVSSTVGEVDRLPILQHALMRAWGRQKREDGWELGLADLGAIGGVGGALGRHADEVMAEAIGQGAPGQRDTRAEALEWIFRSLTDLDADGLGVRRTRHFSELVDVAGGGETTTRALVDRFRAADCSFLAPYGDAPLANDDAVEISHEALIRKWPRLSDRRWDEGRPCGWIWREFQEGQRWRALVFLAQSSAPLSGAATELWQRWFADILKRPAWTKRYAAARPADQDSAPAPTGKPEVEQVEDLFRRGELSLRRQRRLRWLIAGAGSVLGGVVILSFVIYFLWQQQKSAIEAAKVNASQEKDTEVAVSIGIKTNTLIDNICKVQHQGDVEGIDNCKNELLSQYTSKSTAASYSQVGSGRVGAP